MAATTSTVLTLGLAAGSSADVFLLLGFGGTGAEPRRTTGSAAIHSTTGTAAFPTTTGTAAIPTCAGTMSGG